MGFYKLDYHSLNHLFGSFFLVHLGLFFGLDMIPAVSIAFTLGVLWEYMDSMFAGKFIFDSRGGDFIDIIVDAIGCTLAVWI